MDNHNLEMLDLRESCRLHRETEGCFTRGQGWMEHGKGGEGRGKAKGGQGMMEEDGWGSGLEKRGDERGKR